MIHSSVVVVVLLLLLFVACNVHLLDVLYIGVGEDDDVMKTKSVINSLKEEFKQLAVLLKNLLKKKQDYRKFRDEFMYDAPELSKDQLQVYFEKKKVQIYGSENYDELFVTFNDCWDYLNPYLLEHFIIHYGEEILVVKMNKYLEDLRTFMSGTKLTTYWKAQSCRDRKPPAKRPPQGLHEVITKHELSGTSSLQCIEEIRMGFLEKMQLSRFALFIAHFEERCLVITWYVPPQVAEKFARLERSVDFEVLSITSGVETLDGNHVIIISLSE